MTDLYQPTPAERRRIAALIRVLIGIIACNRPTLAKLYEVDEALASRMVEGLEDQTP